MTDRHSIKLNSSDNLAKARKGLDWVASRLGEGWHLLLTRKRSDVQNARMWAVLGQIAKQRPEHGGMNVGSEDYKTMFVHALRKEMRLIPSLEFDGMIPVSNSSSALTVSEFSDLFELMAAFCAREGLDIKDPKEPESPAERDAK
jgi:hypothetical protein